MFVNDFSNKAAKVTFFFVWQSIKMKLILVKKKEKNLVKIVSK